MTYSQRTSYSRSNYGQANIQRLARPQTKVIAAESSKRKINSLIVAVIMVCLLMVIYLVQVNSAHNYSYVINDLNQQQQQLQAEYEALSLEATKLESNKRLVEDTQTKTGYQLPQTVYFD